MKTIKPKAIKKIRVIKKPQKGVNGNSLGKTTTSNC